MKNRFFKSSLMGKHFEVNFKMSFFSLLVPKKLTNRRKSKWHYRKAGKRKKIYIYNFKSWMLSVEEKNQIPEQSFIPKHLRLSGITRTLEKSQPLAWKCLQRSHKQGFHFNFQGSDSYWLFVFPIHCKWKKLKKKFTQESHLTTYFEGRNWYSFTQLQSFDIHSPLESDPCVHLYNREKRYITCSIKKYFFAMFNRHMIWDEKREERFSI